MSFVIYGSMDLIKVFANAKISEMGLYKVSRFFFGFGFGKDMM